ncbi:hypothetical protein [Teredinibacter turnerae]|uniref:hypothetical protein n=1 Tax=Teredinibacter turnerae TaxID=2426 RepID=UPI0003676A82|nr:hypothetical protein [Teredinibacter turnerae]
MKSILFAFVLIPIASVSCPLEGYWKSNEEMTLESMKKAEGLTEPQLNLFSNNFFGKLYLKIECNKFVSVYEDWIETTEYTLISFNENEVVTKYFSDVEGEVEKTSKLEGKCYSMGVLNDKFKEYFCPIGESDFEAAIEESLNLKSLQESENESCKK